MYRLRHHCFNFIVMPDVFMVHAPDSLVSHHEEVDKAERNQWHSFNLELFYETAKGYGEDDGSCIGKYEDIRYDPMTRRKFEGEVMESSTPKLDKKVYEWSQKRYARQVGTDPQCGDGVLSDDCAICCEESCGLCGGSGCSKRHFMCCGANVVRSRRSCNDTLAPCQMATSGCG